MSSLSGGAASTTPVNDPVCSVPARNATCKSCSGVNTLRLEIGHSVFWCPRNPHIDDIDAPSSETHRFICASCGAAGPYEDGDIPWTVAGHYAQCDACRVGASKNAEPVQILQAEANRARDATLLNKHVKAVQSNDPQIWYKKTRV